MNDSGAPDSDLHDQRTVRFNDIPLVVSQIETLEDKVDGDEVVRQFTLSVPVTMQLFRHARELVAQNDLQKAINIYTKLVEKSVLLNNSQRLSFLRTGGGQRFVCEQDTREEDGLWPFVSDEEEKLGCECYACAATRRDPDSLRQLGLMFRIGFGTVKDPEECIKWTEHAFHADSVAAFLDMAKYFEEGFGVERNDELAFELFVKASEKDNAEGLFEVGLAYLDSEFIQDDALAIEYLERAAAAAYAPAQLELGEIYANGFAGVEENAETAFEWFLKAAKRGLVQAQWIIAQAYESGYGVEMDLTEAFKWYVRAGIQGHEEAQRTVGYFYELGSHADGIVQQNLEQAFSWYERAAHQRDPIAQYNLANMYWKGRGVEKDYDHAVFWCTEAAEQGDLAAQVRVAEILSERKGENDAEKMMYWLEFAANEGHLKAQYLFGQNFIDGIGCDRDVNEGIGWLIESAQRGYAPSQYALAQLYRAGEFIGPDDTSMCSWCTKAAEQGFPAALSMLARLYDTGRGVQRNPRKALILLEEAVEADDPAGQFYLAYMYQRGTALVKPDLSEAFNLYNLAAENGEKRAQCNLGSMYKKGQFVEKNYERAAYWFQQSAEQDHPRGQVNLGIMCEKGWGVEQNYEEAAEWYFQSASQGNQKAQLQYGLLCLHGRGVPQNNFEAVYWFELSARQGNPFAHYHMGRAYEEGILVEQNTNLAIQMYEEGARHGIIDAHLRLSTIYDYGFGVISDIDKAIEHLETAAYRGSVEAQIARAEFERSTPEIFAELFESIDKDSYRKGQELYQSAIQLWFAADKIAAVSMFEEAGVRGSIEALMFLGKLYNEGGNGEARNIIKAAIMYERAARLGNEEAMLCVAILAKERKRFDESCGYLFRLTERGNSDAMVYLGMAYLEGLGVHCSYASASLWLHKAAIGLKNSLGFFHLGKAYTRGHGADCDPELGLQFVLKSAYSGNRDAMRFLIDLYDSYEDEINSLYWKSMLPEYGLVSLDEDVEPEVYSLYLEQKNYAVNDRQDILTLVLEKHIPEEYVNIVFPLLNDFLDEFLYVVERSDEVYNSNEFVSRYPIFEALSLALREENDEKQKGIEFMNHLADSDNSRAQLFTGTFLELGYGCKPHINRALDRYLQAADRGCSTAAWNAANIFSNDSKLLWYCLCMQANHDEMIESLIFNIEEMHPHIIDEYQNQLYSTRTKRSWATFGVIWNHIKNHELKNLQCLKSIFECLGTTGLIVRPVGYNEDETFEDLARSGDVNAQLQLARQFMKSPVPNYIEAVHWLQRSSVVNMEASLHLGDIFYNGLGHPSDPQRALENYKQAAYGGIMDAMVQLGRIYETEQVSEKNVILAYYWYRLALDLGHAEVIDHCSAIEANYADIQEKYVTLIGESIVKRFTDSHQRLQDSCVILHSFRDCMCQKKSPASYTHSVKN